MLEGRIRIALLGLIALVAAGGSTDGGVATSASPSTNKGLDKRSALLAIQAQPLRFEANGGQAPDGVHFVARRGGATLSLADDGATTLALQPPAEKESRAERKKKGGDHARAKAPLPPAARLSFKVAGARHVTPVGSNELQVKTNYLIGNDRSKWITDIASYEKVTYPSVLDGVDLVYHGEHGQLEYDFVVAPGADPSAIAMEVGGSEDLSLTSTGDVAINVGGRALIQARPRVYQHDAQGREIDVAASYRLLQDNKVSIVVASYDRSRPLVIDPVVAYSTFLGGSGNDEANSVTADASGNAFVAGSTFVNEEPVVAGAQAIHPAQPAEFMGWSQDAFVAKLDSSGHLAYFTYFGGSSDDYGLGVALDSGRPVVTGYTYSNDFVVTTGSQSGSTDAFVAELNDAGNGFALSTFVSVGTDNYAYAIAVSGGVAYVGGYTYGVADLAPSSVTVPNGNVCMCIEGQTCGELNTCVPVQKFTGGFIAGVSLTTGSTTGSRIVGGSGVNGVATDPTNGDVYVAGARCDYDNGINVLTQTAYDNTSNGSCDAYFARLTPAGTSFDNVYGSYLGSANWESANAIAVGASGQAYITGEADAPTFCTSGPCPSFPVVNAFQAGNAGGEDAFVAHFDTTATGAGSLVYSTLLGGSGDEWGAGISVDALGQAYVTGGTQSANFPTTPASDRGAATDEDAFITEVGANGSSLVYSAYFGGGEDDEGRGIAVNGAGIYLVGTTGFNREKPASVPQANLPTTSPPVQSTFPVTANAAQPAFGGGGSDGFAAKIALAPLVISPSDVSLSSGGAQTFVASGGTGTGYVFTIPSNNSGATINASTGAYTAGTNQGTDIVRVTDLAGQTAAATVHVTAAASLELNPQSTKTPPRGTISFTASGGTAPYLYAISSNASGGTIGANGVYVAGAHGNVNDIVRVTDNQGQTKTAVVSVGPPVTIAPGFPTTAPNGKVIFTAQGGSGNGYVWTATEGVITADGIFTAPGGSTVVTVNVKDSLGNTASVSVSVGGAIALSPVDPQTYPHGTIQFSAVGGQNFGYTWSIVNGQGSTIDSGTGLFTAGPKGDVVETVKVTDGLNNSATTQVTVGPALKITPDSQSIAASAVINFAASGGSGEGYNFGIQSSQSGGSVTAAGVYTAGTNGGTDIVKLVDSVGNIATATLTVAAAPPPEQPPPADTTPPPANTSNVGNGRIDVGGSGNDNGGCAVSSRASSAPSFTSLLGGLAVAMLLVRRRRSAR